MFKALLRIAGWVLVGLVGTVAVFSAMFLYVGYQVPVKLYGGGVDIKEWDSGLVIALGTWVIEGDRQAAPLQHTVLTCQRDAKECKSSTAEISYGGFLAVDSDRYEIIRWTDDTIDFASSALCVNYTYNINRISARVVATRTPKKDGPALCGGLGRGTFQLSLKDGYLVESALKNEAWARAEPFAWATLGALWLFILTRILRRRTTVAVRAG